MEVSSAKFSPNFAVLYKQFPNCFLMYPVRDRIHITSKSGDFEKQMLNMTVVQQRNLRLGIDSRWRRAEELAIELINDLKK